MTNHRVGKTNTRDPRPWRTGKQYKKGALKRGRLDSTNRYLRRTVKAALRHPSQECE